MKIIREKIPVFPFFFNNMHKFVLKIAKIAH